MSKKNILKKEVIHSVLNGNYQLVDQYVDAVDKDGRSLLMHAVLSGDIVAVKHILLRPQNINLLDKIGWSSLHYAAQNHIEEAARVLLENGADIEIKDSYGNTPLWRAVFASQGKGEIINILLQFKADINNKNDNGISPIDLADTIDNYNVIQFFSAK